MGAVFYDGLTARPRDVRLVVDGSGLVLHEGEDLLATWPAAGVRRRDGPAGVMRLSLDKGPPLARLDVADAQEQAQIRAHCPGLELAQAGERVWRVVLWSCLAAVSLILSVLFLVPLAADRLAALVPVSLERRLGTAVDNQLKLLLGKSVCADPEGVAALYTLRNRLESASGPGMLVEVAVLPSSQENAVALPGGRIYLFRGLLDRTESVDEIAGVLAHEIGHAAHRDGLRNLIRSAGASYLLGLVFGDVGGGGAIVVAARALIDTAHSREAETAADAFAGATMLTLGRSPAGTGRLLMRIAGNETKRPAFLSTHPVTDQRLKSFELQVPVRAGAPLLSEQEWRALKEICKTS